MIKNWRFKIFSLSVIEVTLLLYDLIIHYFYNVLITIDHVNNCEKKNVSIFIEGKKNVSRHTKISQFYTFYSWAQVHCIHNKTMRLGEIKKREGKISVHD